MMAPIMKVTGYKIRGMELVHSSQMPKINTKALGLMTRSQAREKWSFTMGDSMKVIGVSTCSTV